MPVSSPEAPSAGQRSPEQPPVPIGYASALPVARPVRRLWGAVIALATGLVLLGIALYAVLSITTVFSAPQGQALRDVVPPMLGIFAGLCTVTALVFLGVGLKWLGGVSRAVL